MPAIPRRFGELPDNVRVTVIVELENRYALIGLASNVEAYLLAAGESSVIGASRQLEVEKFEIQKAASAPPGIGQREVQAVHEKKIIDCCRCENKLRK